MGQDGSGFENSCARRRRPGERGGCRGVPARGRALARALRRRQRSQDAVRRYTRARLTRATQRNGGTIIAAENTTADAVVGSRSGLAPLARLCIAVAGVALISMAAIQ